jgi:CubicO group peptidase (beta-lactamase class C family)
MRLRSCLLLLSLCLTACRGPEAEAPATAAEAARPAPLAQLGPWLQAEAAADRFSGAVIVARGDQVLHRAAYGPADRKTGAPLTPEHRFRLASLSKQFTAAAVLRLQDQGKLSVDDPLCRWVQPCPEAWRPITLHHLLTHQSGVPDLMTRRDWPKLRFQEWTPAELVADSARLPLDFEPGTDVKYSNAAYNLLGSVVESASGRPFAEQLRADLLDPLGMKNTGWDDDTVPLAMGYAKTAEGLGRRPRSAAKVVFASGALYSNLDDMLAWSRALHGGRVLSERSYAQMTAADPARHPVRARWGVPQRFGYGLFSGSPGLRVLPPFADRQLFHSGSWSGFRAHMAHQPDADVHLIVLSNNYDGETSLGFLTSRGMAEALGRLVPTGRLPSDPRPLTRVPEATPAPVPAEPASPTGA